MKRLKERAIPLPTYIALDFDGTCVTHEFPEIGKDIGAIPVLKKFQKAGCKICLFTMRSDRKDGYYLTQAVNWLSERGIKLYGINENPSQKHWTSSNKVYANLYIDDAALGAPLIFDKTKSKRGFIDWEAIDSLFFPE